MGRKTKVYIYSQVKKLICELNWRANVRCGNPAVRDYCQAYWYLKQKLMAQLSTGTNLHCTMHHEAKPKQSFPQAQYPTGTNLSWITNLDLITPVGWLT